mgnify:CR=1 FL=1
MDDQATAAGLRAAVEGFLNEFKAFQGEVKVSLQQQDDRMTMLDRKTTTHSRPVLTGAAIGGVAGLLLPLVSIPLGALVGAGFTLYKRLRP